MNTCDTCKWWGENDTFEAGAQEHTRTLYVSLYRNCECEKLSPVEPPHRKTNFSTGNVTEDAAAMDSATPVADETDRCGFITGPKFGCIHHEPK